MLNIAFAQESFDWYCDCYCYRNHECHKHSQPPGIKINWPTRGTIQGIKDDQDIGHAYQPERRCRKYHQEAIYDHAANNDGNSEHHQGIKMDRIVEATGSLRDYDSSENDIKKFPWRCRAKSNLPNSRRLSDLCLLPFERRCETVRRSICSMLARQGVPLLLAVRSIHA